MKFLADNWWYFLILGAMAYMMTKGGGCCGVGHSTQGKDNNTQGKSSSGGCCGGGHKE